MSFWCLGGGFGRMSREDPPLTLAVVLVEKEARTES